MPRRKNTEVRVYVVEYGREKLMLRIKWPDGRLEHETLETGDRTVAERQAGVREAQLREQGPKPNGKMQWSAFRKEVETKLIVGLARKTQQKYSTVFNAFERLTKPPIVTLGQITTTFVSDFIAAWRESGAQDATLFGSLGHLRAAFAWGKEQGWLPEMPVIRKPTIDDDEPTRGRAVTAEEFTRIIAAVPEVVFGKAAEWQHLIEGLYLSGLRLGEALSLSWDIPGTIHVDLTGEYPMLNIPRMQQKKRKAELWPVTPDFAEFLSRVSVTARTGFVFQCRMPLKDATTFRRPDTIGKVISEIGEKAKVVVDSVRGKHASAHDLRRSFGVRWSQVLMPGELQALMRHADISTTMKFYTRQQSNMIAEKIWEKGKLLGNTSEMKQPKKCKST